MKKIVFITLAALSPAAYSSVSDLLISEVAVVPTAGEFIEIYNGGATAVDLTNVYLTDATYSNGGVYYYQIVTGAGGGGGFADFHARFPTGAMIPAGAYQTIALNGSTNFNTTYGVDPTYELYEDGAADAIPDMLEARAGSINGQGGLSGGEVAVLYSWDGNSDLVKDLDYVLWGDKVEAIDKSGISIDGPDVGSGTSTYANDTAIASQAVISASSHASGKSWQRNVPLNEGSEVQSGGNGFLGSDETSEDLNNTFFEDTPTPNAASTPPTPTAPNVVINEVDAVGSTEFIELYGTSGATLNDVTLVFYQGSDDTIYKIIDLSGNNMGASGYFVIGDTSLTPDVTLAANSLNDDANAVALYFSNVSNFNIGDSITTTNIMDALVYDSGQSDDVGLLALLNVGQAQINEDGNANSANESNARCPNGTGGAQNTASYAQVAPTAGAANSGCPLGSYYAGVDTTNATTLRQTVHDIIKVSVSNPYSSSSTDTWDMLSFADEDPLTNVDPNVVEKVIMVYKNDSLTYNGGGQQPYNREHTWPQSYGFKTPTNNAARTDAHHLMMSDKNYNNNRGNLYFDNCNASCTERPTTAYNGIGGGSGTYPGNSNWFDGNSWEVWNERKGDIARAMFYMDVRYAGDRVDNFGVQEPDLILTDNTSLIQTHSTLQAVGYMGLLSTLLDWHTQDPVDATEMARNDVVFGFQMNRNPFIDHPEWVACIFQNICPGDLIFKHGFE